MRTVLMFVGALVSALVVACHDESTESTGSGGSDAGGGGDGGASGCPHACPEPAPCHSATCAAGACEVTLVADGVACKSALGAGTCASGACVGGECAAAADCHGGSECTLHYCTLGFCSYPQDTAQVVCAGGKGQCVAGTCQSNGCFDEPDGVACKVCDLPGHCAGAACVQSVAGPPHCP